MKLTKTNVKNIRKEKDSNLTKYVINYILERWDDYDDKHNIFKDVLNHGCSTGIVSSLIYLSDTSAFYKKYLKDINDWVVNAIDNYGCDFKDLFLNWDKSDPLAQDCYNQQLLAWFGFEEEMRDIYDYYFMEE